MDKLPCIVYIYIYIFFTRMTTYWVIKASKIYMNKKLPTVHSGMLWEKRQYNQSHVYTIIFYAHAGGRICVLCISQTTTKISRGQIIINRKLFFQWKKTTLIFV